jgi:lipid-A-disaccharide synthase
VKKMRRLVDHVLCSLPFEEPWFRQHGLSATFVGHPFFDEVRRHAADEKFLEAHRNQPGPLVAILPGSRTQEVVNNLRWFLLAAAKIRQAVPEVRFAVASFKPHQAEIARRAVEQSGLVAEICTAKTPELMRLADCAISVSGSVSLELLYHTTPTVILYWISRPAYFVQRFFRKVKYITLVNLLAAGGLEQTGRQGDKETRRQGEDRRCVKTPDLLVSPSPCLSLSFPSQPEPEQALFPEYLTCEDKSDEIARHVIEWLKDPAKRAERVEALAALKAEVAHGGASRRAAEYILDAIGLSALLGNPQRQQVELALQVA